MKKLHLFRRLAAYGTGVALAASGVALAAPARGESEVAAQGLSASAGSAIDWLEGQLAASGHRFQTSFDGQQFDDIGLTIDALLAIASAGRNSDAEATATTNYVLEKAASYVSFEDDRYAGPLGKLMVLAQARNLPTTNVGGFNLENEIRERLQPSGRFSDKSDFGDFSNGVGQAFDMLALSRTPGDVPPNSVTWLLAQQCPNGGFRIDYSEGAACTDDADADVDATAFALMALAVSDLTPAQDAKVDDGLDYLFENQADSGLIGNANSSGVAASVIRTYGLVPEANEVAAGVGTLQVTTGADKGAIGLTKADADGAKANGISDAKRSTFHRATAQAVLALGLPSYVDQRTVAPVEPRAHIETSTGTAKAGDPISLTGGGFTRGETVNVTVESDPVAVGAPLANYSGELAHSFNLPASVPAGPHTIRLAGASSGVVVTAPLTVTAAQVATTTPTSTPTLRATIARTGTTTGSETMLGGALLLAGASLLLATRRRKIVYPFKR